MWAPRRPTCCKLGIKFRRTIPFTEEAILQAFTTHIFIIILNIFLDFLGAKKIIKFPVFISISPTPCVCGFFLVFFFNLFAAQNTPVIIIISVLRQIIWWSSEMFTHLPTNSTVCCCYPSFDFSFPYADNAIHAIWHDSIQIQLKYKIIYSFDVWQTFCHLARHCQPTRTGNLEMRIESKATHNNVKSIHPI